ncbi:helix-turn-helix domain-containing protein [Vagococcus carniphilus]|uniref:HTH domain-containing protein n=1 Tax=Vagococcus carniphilus TaxID=218144 RepID=A0AAW8U315_9ENTE|nr:HTH domain-containing protein [Vagococcus carniphilus]MDT2830510.1 HTH domain-containing protein [Vagococcus carniphilus]MDT2832545.1 HTH domain-containing protein [Vagococcus carniphilus]MDT2839808.1 HTH domain-containing protein [Vagococcus carniphilus]MDT2854745.1 HTH domain-containing protein [Vagococcus carniphilus]MDT2864053.1 HTH domain-containing protein [Vagococcus carniphilus]
MLSILDSTSKRLIDTLELLLKSDNWLTVRQIADLLKVSEKTIHDDLNYIQDNLDDQVGLEFLSPYGIRASKLSVNVFLTIQSQILLKSIPIQFILVLAKNPNQTLNDYAEILHISRSTLYRYLPKISDYFNQYNLEVKKNGSLYSIASKDEYLYRRFFSTFLFEIHGYNVKPIISEQWQSFFKERLTRMYSFNQEEISDLQISYYSIFYQLSIEREKQNNRLAYVQSFIGQDAPFTEEEEHFLFLNEPDISLNCFTKIESAIYIHRHTQFALTDPEFIDEVSCFLDKLFYTFQIKEMEAEKKRLLDFVVDLCINVKYFKIPYHFFYDRFHSFSKQVELNNTAAFNLMTHLIKELSLKIKLDFSIYIDHLVYLFVVTLPQVIQAQLNQPILIVSSYSVDHGYFLLKMIEGQLNIESSYFENIICIHESDLKHYDLANFQLIISNLALRLESTKYILIQDFPSKKNITSIKNILLSNTKVE